MRKSILLLAGALGVILVVSATRSRSGVSAVRLKVVNEAGDPVVDAVITPDGLRPKGGGSHYFWGEGRDDAKPTPVRTDAKGFVRVQYPRYVLEKMETGEISFSVDHPGYCPERPFLNVDASPPRKAPMKVKLSYYWVVATRGSSALKLIKLRRGPEISVSGYLKSPDNLEPIVYPMISEVWAPPDKIWQPSKTPGVFVTRRALAGWHSLRLAHFATDGRTYFSDRVTFKTSPQSTNRFSLELKPGVDFKGRLDESVPRPIRNGRVIVEAYSLPEKPSIEPVGWHTWAPIQEDGSFSFSSLPAGDLELVAVCDGHISKTSHPENKRIWKPQRYRVPANPDELVIPMEATAGCEVTVQDEGGKPIQGAAIAFWPNINWVDWSSTLIGADAYHTSDVLKSKNKPRPEVRFMAETDARGKAVITNLPALALELGMKHREYDLPIDASSQSREAKAILTPGETMRATIRAVRRGKDVLEQ